MKKAREPLDTEQSVERRRSVEPAEWYVGRHVDATGPDGRDFAPRRHVAHGGGERDGSLAIATSGRAARTSSSETVSAEWGRRDDHVQASGQRERFRLQRSARRRRRTVRTTRKVNARTLRVGDWSDALGNASKLRFGVARERFAPLGYADRRADFAKQPRRTGQRAVEQQIGNRGLRLDALGERDVRRGRRADVDDDVRLRLQHALGVRRVAAARQAGEFRQRCNRIRQKRALVVAWRARPADPLFGRKREHEHPSPAGLPRRRARSSPAARSCDPSHR